MILLLAITCFIGWVVYIRLAVHQAELIRLQREEIDELERRILSIQKHFQEHQNPATPPNYDGGTTRPNYHIRHPWDVGPPWWT